ncbi:winged helix-turn-helix domain-containing tetratricopeptide repeat protein [Prosthecomicrobium sp. N25]|uniref:winged helix-turn-helix domain-containing tetratricopeptide repeat protein n=1 Tax=Prosthecomicrobium sp. N25 TaxID=3129254 RepID=UPI00307804CD
MASGDFNYLFGPFCLHPETGILLRAGEPTMLGRRAVALLQALLDSAGAPVSKAALVEAGWGSLAVAENNLTVQIAALRRVLVTGPDHQSWIETLPRRGYRYIGPAVTRGSPDKAQAGPPLPERASVAVLPFADLSGSPENRYFADGMVDDIINGLSRIRSVFVTARGSSFTYRSGVDDLRRVGHELGVRYLLEGAVRREAGRVRVTVSLVDASTRAQIWADRYDRSSDDLFGLQDEIALSVVGSMAPNIRRAEIDRVKRKRPENLDAYDLVLRAQPDVDSGMPDQVTRALSLLERAIALDPSYALAHGNAAMCHHCLFLRAGLREENRVASIHHARCAIQQGSDDATALTLAGFSLGMDGHDRDAAFAAMDSALALSPSSALTHILGSVLLGWGGQAERAIEWSSRGLRLSPFDPWAFAAYDAQAMSHLLLGRYEDACRAACRAVQANPVHSITYVQLTAALAKLGRLQEAKIAARRVLDLHPAFRFSRQFAGVNCAPELAQVLGDALRAGGLPE